LQQYKFDQARLTIFHRRVGLDYFYQRDERMNSREAQEKALEFHGRRRWACVTGMRVGLTALEKLGVKRSGGIQLCGSLLALWRFWLLVRLLAPVYEGQYIQRASD
jgi:hypothetical protein